MLLYLTPTVPLFPWRTKWILGRLLYNFNSFCNFLKHLLKIRRHISLSGQSIFFQLLLKSKSYATLSPKWFPLGNTKLSQKSKTKFLKFVFDRKYFLSIWKYLIHSIWTSNEKVIVNLVLVAL